MNRNGERRIIDNPENHDDSAMLDAMKLALVLIAIGCMAGIVCIAQWMVRG